MSRTIRRVQELRRNKQNSVTSATLFFLNLINLSYALLPWGEVLGSMGGDPSASLAAPLTQGSQGLRIATGAEGPRNDNIRKGQKKDGLPEQSIFCVVLQEITSWCSAG